MGRMGRMGDFVYDRRMTKRSIKDLRPAEWVALALFVAFMAWAICASR
jgi:hypothetical protein